jgi:hypothetical protein
MIRSAARRIAAEWVAMQSIIYLLKFSDTMATLGKRSVVS